MGSGLKGVVALTTPGASTTIVPAIFGDAHSDDTEYYVAGGGELPSTPAMERAKATVGGPLGLALTITPKDSLGFITAATLPLLRRSGKSKMALASRLYDKPVIIDMEAAMHALAGKVMVGQRQQSGRVRLDSIKLWVQIWGLPLPIKTVEMGYILGDKLGKVLTVAHRNKKIIDEYLRMWVEYLVDEPLRKAIDTTPVGSTIEISYNVKYEKLPKFCLACGLLGHTSARFSSIPKEIQKPAFSTDIKASTFWSTMQTSSGPSHRQFGLGGRQGDRDLRDSENLSLSSFPKRCCMQPDVQASTGRQHKIMDAAESKLEIFYATHGAMHAVVKEVGQDILPLGVAKVVHAEGGSIGGVGGLVGNVPRLDIYETGAESK
ncbi:hypothetical protein D1007_06111 [Hordeum vulgare]|nr:hypothetical protein D1007_06111 [Hordeum vulgare]